MHIWCECETNSIFDYLHIRFTSACECYIYNLRIHKKETKKEMSFTSLSTAKVISRRDSLYEYETNSIFDYLHIRFTSACECYIYKLRIHKKVMKKEMSFTSLSTAQVISRRDSLYE